MPKGTPYSEDFKLNAVEQALKAKIEDGTSYSKTAEKIGVHPTLIGRWLRQYEQKDDPPPELISEMEEALNAETSDDGRLTINDEYRRETIAASLVMSGYIVWLTTDGGNHYINFQSQ